MASDDNRSKALDLAVASIEKTYGKGSIMRLGAEDAVAQTEVTSTGSLSLDLALGVGGYPSGRIIEIYGPESSGKTTLTLHAVAECQKKGGVAAFIDAEHALDVSYARRLGVNTEELLVAQPDFGEQALEIADTLVRSGAVDMIVVDSVAALVPETTTGGNALKFYSSVRLDVRRIGAIKTGDQAIGNRTRVKVVKNKMAPPFKTCEFDILFGEGISRTGDVLDLGVEDDVVDKSGAWYSYRGDRIGQGRENARGYLKEHPDTLADIERRVLEKRGINRGGAAPSAEAEADAGGKADKPAPAAAKGAKPDAKSASDGKGGGRAQRPRPRA